MDRKQRMERLKDLMKEHSWDLLVCARPMNVLMLSGYWPVVGTGVACADSEGIVQLLVPEDEEELARRGCVEQIATFRPGSLDSLAPVAELIQGPLKHLVKRKTARIGCESGETSEPGSYAAMHLYGCAMPRLLKHVFATANVEDAGSVLAEVRAVKTEEEIDRIRHACQTVGRAFSEGAQKLAAGMEEREAADLFIRGLDNTDAVRAGGMVACMSGANAGHAYGAFARATRKKIQPGDLVLTHCNSYEDGFWTDVTRTYRMGSTNTSGSNERDTEMREAISLSRAAALARISPGVLAREVDQAARETLEAHGFGRQFRHSTGHGVGFEAINANAIPRLHPKSPDRLEPGMVFNVEPAIYFPDYGGMRHCDVVTVNQTGVEVLTDF
jgi:Xaa-Pro aminopeptidase